MTAAGIDACHLAGMGPVTLAKGQACTQAHTTHWYIHSHIHAHTTHRQVAHTGTHMHMAHTCTHVHTHMHMAHTCTHVHTRAHATHTHAETRALGASGRSGGPVLAQWEGCLLPGGLRDTHSLPEGPGACLFSATGPHRAGDVPSLIATPMATPSDSRQFCSFPALWSEGAWGQRICPVPSRLQLLGVHCGVRRRQLGLGWQSALCACWAGPRAPWGFVT